MARFAWVGMVALAACVSACGGGKTAGCRVPPQGTRTGTLLIEHRHEFGRNFEVTEVAYKLDDCLLLRSNDLASLRKPVVDFGSFQVPAGRHELRLMSQFRSDFGADMHDYVWSITDTSVVEVPADQSVKLLEVYSEDEGADPRQRMRRKVTLEAVSGEPAAEEASASTAP